MTEVDAALAEVLDAATKGNSAVSVPTVFPLACENCREQWHYDSSLNELERRGSSPLMSSLLGGGIGLVIGVLLSICGFYANVRVSFLVINTLGAVCVGVMIGVSERHPQHVGVLYGIALFSLLAGILGPWDRRIVIWLLGYAFSGCVLGLVIGYVFALIRLIKWWVR
jgi:hypothetical protein